MNYKEIIFEKEKPLAIITLNRPEILNAYTPRMGQEITKALEEADKDRNIRAVIVTGAGRGFCSGADRTPRATRATVPIRRDTIFGPLVRKLMGEFNKPMIAAINGIVAGGGFSFAMACDIRIASDRASFSQIFVKRGITPDNGSTWLLPRLVGMARACELVWTGDIIDAAEADRIGLVNRVVPHDDLLTVVKDLATRIASGPPITIQLAKHALYQGALNTNLQSQMELELHHNAICGATEDRKEGMRAFIEKREPIFKGK